MSRRSSEELAKKRSRRGNSTAGKAWQGFVELSLTAAQKEHLALLSEEDYPDLYAFIRECLEDGYKLSFVRDFKHHCVIASLTGKGEGNVNVGYSLSARGPDLDKAIVALHFKHVEICERLIWADREESQRKEADLWG